MRYALDEDRTLVIDLGDEAKAAGIALEIRAIQTVFTNRLNVLLRHFFFTGSYPGPTCIFGTKSAGADKR